MGDVFYIVGIALTLLAVLIAFVGMRDEGFPASRGITTVVLGIMGALVVATAAFAVVLSREEVEHREQEQAELLAESGGEEPAAEGESSSESGSSDPGGGTGATPVTPTGGSVGSDEPSGDEQTVDLSSPDDGSLAFDTDALDATAGSLTIAYTNPSAVPHNVAIEADGESLAQGSTVTGGDVSSAETELEPGEYIFYCSIAGHREAGMEGTLTVE